MAPRANLNFSRFFWTSFLLSQSVRPRFRTFSPFRSEKPPGRVLKPWMSQGSLLSSADWTIFRPAEFLMSHFPCVAGAMGDGELER